MTNLTPSEQFNTRYSYRLVNRLHPKINSFLADLKLDIKVYKVKGTYQYAVQWPNGDGYQLYTYDYPDYAVDKALEIADKITRNTH
jgi:hypothetical protein